MNFRTENRNHSYGVAFGAGSWVGIDQFGLVVPNSDLKDPLDRQFFHSGQAILDKACRLARDVLPGPYGSKGSARRRKFCDRVASIATDMEANL